MHDRMLTLLGAVNTKMNLTLWLLVYETRDMLS